MLQHNVNDDPVPAAKLVFVYRKTVSLSNRIAYSVIVMTCLAIPSPEPRPFTPPSPPDVQYRLGIERVQWHEQYRASDANPVPRDAQLILLSPACSVDARANCRPYPPRP